jgi:anti-sigma regulatory factor (Ser/Thr protein kinase)
VCRVVSTELRDEVSSVPTARHLTVELLDRWELPTHRDLAMLLTSELVTNALLHAGNGLSLTVAIAEGALEIAVGDHDHLSSASVKANVPRFSDVHDNVIAEGGRGLLLVDSLTDDWGVDQGTDEKRVWGRVSAEDWVHRLDCACHRDDIGRVRLASGRFALAMPGPWDR